MAEPVSLDFLQTIVNVGWPSGKPCFVAVATYDSRSVNAGITLEDGEADDIRTDGPVQIFAQEGAILLQQRWVVNLKKFTPGVTKLRLTCSEVDPPDVDTPSNVWTRTCTNLGTDPSGTGIGPWNPEPTWRGDIAGTHPSYSLSQTFQSVDHSVASIRDTRSFGVADLSFPTNQNPHWGLNCPGSLTSANIVHGSDASGGAITFVAPAPVQTWTIGDNDVIEAWVGLNGNMGPPTVLASSGNILGYRGQALTPSEVQQGVPFNDGSAPEFPDKHGVVRSVSNPLGEIGGDGTQSSGWVNQTNTGGFGFPTNMTIGIFNGQCLKYTAVNVTGVWPIAKGTYNTPDERKQDKFNNDGSLKTAEDTAKDIVETHLLPISSATLGQRIFDPFAQDSGTPRDFVNEEAQRARDAGYLEVTLPDDWKERDDAEGTLFEGAKLDDWYGPGGKYFARFYNGDFSDNPVAVPDPPDFWEFVG